MLKNASYGKTPNAKIHVKEREKENKAPTKYMNVPGTGRNAQQVLILQNKQREK